MSVKIEDVIKLINAGYTKAEIAAMMAEPEEPKQKQTPEEPKQKQTPEEPKQKQTPEEPKQRPEEPKQKPEEPRPAWLDELIGKLDVLSAAQQKRNIADFNQPDKPDAPDAAKIISSFL